MLKWPRKCKYGPMDTLYVNTTSTSTPSVSTTILLVPSPLWVTIPVYLPVYHVEASLTLYVHASHMTDSSTPNSRIIEAFSLCMFLFCTFYQTLPSGPPCSEQQGHQLQARHKIRCLWDPGRGMTRTQFQCWFHLCIYYKSITGSLYAALR